MISFMDQQPTTTLWGGRYLYFDVSHNSQFTSATVTLTLVTVKCFCRIDEEVWEDDNKVSERRRK